MHPLSYSWTGFAPIPETQPARLARLKLRARKLAEASRGPRIRIMLVQVEAPPENDEVGEPQPREID